MLLPLRSNSQCPGIIVTGEAFVRTLGPQHRFVRIEEELGRHILESSFDALKEALQVVRLSRSETALFDSAPRGQLNTVSPAEVIYPWTTGWFRLLIFAAMNGQGMLLSSSLAGRCLSSFKAWARTQTSNVVMGWNSTACSCQISTSRASSVSDR